MLVQIMVENCYITILNMLIWGNKKVTSDFIIQKIIKLRNLTKTNTFQYILKVSKIVLTLTEEITITLK